MSKKQRIILEKTLSNKFAFRKNVDITRNIDKNGLNLLNSA